MITPPAAIGMLGGGQLGRYALMAARTMGYRTVVLDPDPMAPAGAVADEHLVAGFSDPDALARLAEACAVVTTEFENPPAESLHWLADRVPVAPSPAAVSIAQDRIAEKRFLASVGVPTAPWAPLVEPGDLIGARRLDPPFIVKTARLGYDGKGQVACVTTDELDDAWESLGRVPSVAEQRVPLDVELSALVARSSTGNCVVYRVAENVHVGGILDLTVVPARVDATLAADAQRLAVELAQALDYVGVLAVECFVSEGRLLVNELAPRPHNSGHWTLDAAMTDQFTQQVCAVTGASLAPTAMTAPAAAMVNLLGDLWPPSGEPDWSAALAHPDVRLHLYGKRQARPGRKMGHLTVVGDDPDRVAARAVAVRSALTA